MRDSATLAHRLLSISGKTTLGDFVTTLPDGQPVLIPRHQPREYREITPAFAGRAWPLSRDEARRVRQADWASLFPGTFSARTVSCSA
jgi:hypothetical protein